MSWINRFGVSLRAVGLGVPVALAFLAGLVTGPALAAPIVVQGVTINSWGYQLINDDAAEIAKSRYDVIVMDYQRDPSAGGPFTPAELAVM